MAHDEEKREPSGDSLDEVRRRVEERVNEEADQAPSREEEEKVPSSLVDKCLNANEYGLGVLYTAVNDGRFLYNNTTGEWLRWAGHHWERDIMNQAFASVENVVDRLLEESDRVGKREQQAAKDGNEERQKSLAKKKKHIYGKVFHLREDKGRNSCLKFARTCKEPLAVKGNEFDKDPWLLGCPNCVVDLRTGEGRPGRPDDFIMMATPTEWKGLKASRELWNESLLQIHEGQEEVVPYLQRLLGYGITGLSLDRVFSLWYGVHGQNGKGFIVEVLSGVLGPLSGPIQSEMLLDQKRPASSAGPSPDIMRLKGMRLAFASETDKGQKFSSGKVKWLAGGDELVGRNPHDKYTTTFKPSHLLILLTNEKPHAPGDDDAFWVRMQVVNFPWSFIDGDPVEKHQRRAVKGLSDHVVKQEAAGVLAWLVEGALMYQMEGLNPPDIVREWTAEYRKDEDLLGEWIESRCFIHEAAKVQATAAFESFGNWYEMNVSKKVPKQKTFGSMMVKRFKRDKSNGLMHYFGIGLLADKEGQDREDSLFKDPA